MHEVKNNRTVKYIVTWKTKTYKRKDASFYEQEKLKKDKSPSLYVTELIESTRRLK